MSILRRATPSVLGWKSPWDGNEHTPIPASYHLWVRLYWLTRRLRHWVGKHDWHELLLEDGRRFRRCDWCGAIPSQQPIIKVVD